MAWLQGKTGSMTMAKERPETQHVTALAATARRSMIDSQLRVSDVNDEAVLAAFAQVPREDHVPASARGFAYMDRAIALENGGLLAAPLVHGRMLCESSLRADDKVLLVDGGSGYLAALLRAMGIEPQVLDAQVAAKEAGRGEFTLLLIDGAIEHLPAGLVQRLADGARVVTGLVSRGVTRLATGRKIGGGVALLQVAEIGMPVLAAFAAPEEWTF